MNNEAVNHPAHYAYAGIECIDAIEAATSDKTGLEAVCVANVIKYTWRYTKKNGVNDLEKAKWYLEKLISHLENKDAAEEEEWDEGEQSCQTCHHFNLGESEYPCCICKHLILQTDPKYDNSHDMHEIIEFEYDE